MRRAIVRPPAENFADGLTTADLGAPDYEEALLQHARYCEALEACGLALTRLAPDARYPDSTFVEDTAVITERCVVLTRPGAPSRTGETASMGPVLAALGLPIVEIGAPGTLDGGDVCDVDGHFLIGISARTNGQGALSLAEVLARHGFTSETVDVRGLAGVLHLKTGLSSLGGGALLAIDSLRSQPALARYRLLPVAPGEEYAANAVVVNGRVLIAAGYPRLEATLRESGREILALEMSEFRKMDGGLSCLSLRV
jgi:dimethylargininase